MSGNHLYAVVVTFHPDEQVAANLSALCAQVQDVVVVDNGSSPAEIAQLHRQSSRIGFHLIENGENLGIATALNIGIRHVIGVSQARQEQDRAKASPLGESWVMLFDQDSCVTDAFTGTMLDSFLTNPTADRLGILVPLYRDKRFGKPIPADKIATGGIEAAMTSGSLIPLGTFERHGLFVDEFFIDGVDIEFSLRLRKAGLRIEECTDAVLLHSPGAPRFHRIGGFNFQTSNYAPVRRYYQERNKIWIYKRYFSTFPRYCRRLLIGSVKDFAKIVLIEPRKTGKIVHFLRGVYDGILERMGRLTP